MNKGWFQRLLPHLIAVAVFLIVAVIYCLPAIQGRVLNQPDVVQWNAMAKNSFDYKEKHGHFPLWTNSMFSGMPAYQIAMESDVKASPGLLYHVFTLGLPKPVSFFFIACICFYFLSQVLRINPYIGIIGGLAFAYATYNPVLVVTGHDTKMQSIAFMPAVIGSVILLYEKKYLWGAALTALSSSLLIGMNHMQIVYYTLIIAAFMTISYLVIWIRQRDFRHILFALSIALVSGLLGALTNAVTIFTTQEAARTTIRGGTELPDKNATKTGLSKDYSLAYSLYKSEPLVMMVPNMYGGSSEPIEEKTEESKAIESLQTMPQEVANQIGGLRAAYWGGIGASGTAGPPYVGSIICFLALIGFFILDSRHKWWILALTVLTVVMSWGEYFRGFNSMLLDILPMYNKFRAPSVILVIPTLLLGMMAVMTLQKIISMPDRALLWDRYKKGLMLTGGLFVLLLMIYFSADFTAENEKDAAKQISAAPQQFQDYFRTFLNALKDDRKSLFFGSMTRSFFFIAAAAILIWMHIRKKMQAWVMYSIIGVLAFIDLMSVNVKYMSGENYQDEMEYQNNFTPSPADEQIMQDKSYYRVFDLRQGLGTLTYGAMTAYFHRSIGGYHPAKLSIYQDLIEHQLSKFPASLPVVNMLNTKYILQADQQGKESVFTNPGALGPVWFVKHVRYEATPQAVMNALTGFHPKDTAIVFTGDQKLVSYAPAAGNPDSIELVMNDNDEVTYKYKAASNRFAVFSEVYYNEGWKAYVDDKEVPIIRTNYVLRGLSLPAGSHNIRFVFHPDSFYNGETVAQVSAILVWLLILGAAFQTYRRRRVKVIKA